MEEIQLLKSRYANESTHHDKTDYGVKIGYERWTEWTETRRRQSLIGMIIFVVPRYFNNLYRIQWL